MDSLGGGETISNDLTEVSFRYVYSWLDNQTMLKSFVRCRVLIAS